jgi:hypothetical protein
VVDQLQAAPAPLTQVRQRFGNRVLAVLGEVAMAALVYELYSYIQARLSGSAAEALRNGNHIWHAERLLHLDPEPALSHLFERVTPLGVIACYWYVSLHFVATVGVLIYMYRSHGESYRQARAVLAVMTLAALFVFWAFPAAPPHMLDVHRFADVEAHYQQWGWWSDGALPRHAGALENPFAAMPSLHVGWALWCGVTLARLTRRRSLRLLAMAYPAGTVLVVLGTSNHYLADTVAALVLWFVADRIVRQVIRAKPSGDRRVLFLGGIDPRQGDGGGAQHDQQQDQAGPGARTKTQVFVIHDVADEDAHERINSRGGGQARRQRPRLERDLAEQ